VRHTVAAGAGDAILTHDNNALEDTSHKPELEHAGTNTDEIESGFGNVDFTGHQLGNCGTVGRFGVAHARKLGAFLSFDQFVQRKKKQHGKKEARVIMTKEEEEKKTKEMRDEWRLRSYYEIPR